MSAADTTNTLTALTDLGTLLVQKMSGKHIDWGTFLQSLDYTAIRGEVQGLMQSFTPNKLGDALADIQASQKKLLNNRPVQQLSRAELDQYLDLGNIALQIAAAKDTASSLDLFGHWFTSEGLPVLLQLLPVVIPLLI